MKTIKCHFVAHFMYLNVGVALVVVANSAEGGEREVCCLCVCVLVCVLVKCWRRICDYLQQIFEN